MVISDGDVADCTDDDEERRRPVLGDEGKRELLNNDVLPFPEVGEADGSSMMDQLWELGPTQCWSAVMTMVERVKGVRGRTGRHLFLAPHLWAHTPDLHHSDRGCALMPFGLSTSHRTSRLHF